MDATAARGNQALLGEIIAWPNLFWGLNRPSLTKDFLNPAIDPYLARYVSGSNGIGYKERIKIMKLLWDAIGTEFGSRHGL